MLRGSTLRTEKYSQSAVVADDKRGEARRW